MNTPRGIDYSSRYVVPPRIFFGGMKVLVAGDTGRTVESLRAHFFQKRCEVKTAGASEEIQRDLAENSFDLMVCGFLTSDEYALRIIEIVRRQSDVRMLFLTRGNDAGFNAKALNLGADDCLTSPASLFELDARVLRLCRRGMNLVFREAKIVLHHKENIIEIDMIRRTVQKNGRRLSLTRMEYRILLSLALKKGSLISRTDLKKILFRESGESSGHSLNTHVLNLRKKLKTALSIKTVSCRGFVLGA